MSKMGATPLYLANILARASAYSHASATLRVSGTVRNYLHVLLRLCLVCCAIMLILISPMSWTTAATI